MRPRIWEFFPRVFFPRFGKRSCEEKEEAKAWEFLLEFFGFGRKKRGKRKRKKRKEVQSLSFSGFGKKRKMKEEEQRKRKPVMVVNFWLEEEDGGIHGGGMMIVEGEMMVVVGEKMMLGLGKMAGAKRKEEKIFF